MESPIHRTRTGRIVAGALALTAMLLVLPLAGVFLSGQPVTAYLEFPPLTRHVAHAPYSPVVFVVMAIAILAVILPFDWHVFRHRTAQARPPVRHPFPWWGWAGLLSGLIVWGLAWTRQAWFAPWQAYTFSPLWLAYIVVINALTWRRTGQCMLTHRPRFLGRLFFFSALFWWFFEYLNRFVQNWYYEGLPGLSPTAYFLQATLPFATVLPAVLGTASYLSADPRIGAGLDDFVRLQVRHPKRIASAALLVAGTGLALIGVYPDWLYPLLWISPLLILICGQTLMNNPTLFSPITKGRWRRIYVLAMASLICGFFWEMWNMFSLARWVYAVPYVGAFKLFEMPLLGYAGYLTFGLECGVIGDGLAIRDDGEKGDA